VAGLHLQIVVIDLDVSLRDRQAVCKIGIVRTRSIADAAAIPAGRGREKEIAAVERIDAAAQEPALVILRRRPRQ
jgi:hypothetical protein